MQNYVHVVDFKRIILQLLHRFRVRNTAMSVSVRLPVCLSVRLHM